jgi:hypothetical protein
MPIICRYQDNLPIFCTQGVSRSDWSTLCKFISDESALKVIFFDHAHDFFAMVTLFSAKPPKVDLVEVNLRWQEDDEVVLAWQKGMRWISKTLY